MTSQWADVPTRSIGTDDTVRVELPGGGYLPIMTPDPSTLPRLSAVWYRGGNDYGVNYGVPAHNPTVPDVPSGATAVLILVSGGSRP